MPAIEVELRLLGENPGQTHAGLDRPGFRFSDLPRNPVVGVRGLARANADVRPA